MKAMIFAAGLGTRLAPLTDTCPKALIEVGGRPMLERAISNVVKAGATEVIVNIHHHAPVIAEWISSRDFGVPVLISDESDLLLDTGGGVVKAAPLLDGTDEVVLYNVDIFTDLDIREMVEAHRRGGNDVTLLVSSSRSSSRHLLFDRQSGLMRGWHNVSTDEIRSPYSHEIISGCIGMAFGGVHVINRPTIDLMKEWGDSPRFSITSFYIDCCDRLSISAYEPATAYTWVDIGRPDTLAHARTIAGSISSDKKS